MASTSTTSPPPASPKAPSSASAAAPASSPKPSSETPRPILETTWHALSQGPPPALREILSAYNAKGEGDRDMLIALLNAKSAEDQRLAALATLHQTVLQMQHAIAIAAVTAQSPPGRAPPASASQLPQPQGSPRSQSQLQPPQSQPRRKRSHADYAPDAYRHHAYDEREPTLPPSPESSASSPPRSEFPHLSNPGTMSIRTLLHPSKRRRENGYDERAYDDRYDERAYDERDREREHRDRDREYRVRDAPRRPHVVVHPPSVERDSHRYAVRTSSARDEAAEGSGRSP